MEKMSYKTFVWPQNPRIYREETGRQGFYQKNDAGEDVFLHMNLMTRVITGEGCFLGSTAYEDFKRLAALMEEATPGDLRHPVWGSRYCYFTGLTLIQEPRENCVRYTFEFRQALTDGFLPK